MGRYLLRRLAQFIPVFFGTTLLLFALVFAMPGDPILGLAGTGGLPDSVRDALRDEYNLDDPFLVQYGKYLGVVPDEDEGFSGVLQGDFGTDFNRRPVTRILQRSLPNTARLAVGSMTVVVVVGLAGGIAAAVRKGGAVDNVVLVATILALSVPVFVLALVAQLLVGVQLGWLPVSGTRQGWTSFILPSVVLGSASVAYITRLTRTTLVENLRADYVRTATAKGLKRRRVVGVHALRGALVPVVTALGLEIAGLMGGAIVVESIFNIPGVGREMLGAALRQEGSVVVGLATFLVVVYLVSSLMVDLLYAVLDPRIRHD